MPTIKCSNHECGVFFKIDENRRKYCSRSCAVTINNHLFPKRKLGKRHFCSCGKRKSRKANICLECVREKKGKRTLKDIFQEGGVGVDKWVRVREDARRRMGRWGVGKKCEACSWDKHTHTIHVKPIASFSLDTILNIVNARENLKRLCPNCHWLFDNKKLKI